MGDSEIAKVQPFDRKEEIPLSGRLGEFRTALREEMEAARRNESSSAVPLINGRRIAQIGGGYQYAFDVENLLNLPGDAPGNLYVPDQPPQEVIVVSAEGMTITLSVQQDLGKIVPNARLQSNLALLMRRLIVRIEELADKSNAVGDRILGDTAISGEPTPVDTTGLNADQLTALTSSLGRNATFIWGPPGTGKTRTIGAIGEHLYRRQRSVLLVSHTNAAVDESLQRIADAVGIDELPSGKILRVGDPVPDRSLSDEKYREVLLKTHTDRRSASLAARRDECEAKKSSSVSEVLRLSRLIDMVEWVEEAEKDIASMAAELEKTLVLEAAVDKARATQKALISQTGHWASETETARDAKAKLVKIAQLDDKINKQIAEVAAEESLLNVAEASYDAADEILEETQSVGWLTRRWRNLPHPEEQGKEVHRLRNERDAAKVKTIAAKERLVALQQKRARFVAEVEAFLKKHSASPDQMLAKAKEHAKQLEDVQQRLVHLLHETGGRRESLEGVLTRRLEAVRRWGLSVEKAIEASEMLDAVRQAHDVAKLQVAGQDLLALSAQRNELNASIRALDAELREIEESLKRVEELVIADAVVVATTLTRAYLRDSIQSRRFDTVILDEASMAPIPAIWVAASTATANAVIVGDFKQLPPIVISERDMPKKWLGRDVFEVAGLDGTEDLTGRRVDLLEQHRMHPYISRIPNELLYEKLVDAQGMDRKGEAELAEWYRTDWEHDHPVLLVDTGPVGAWVTSVSRGSRASRLNFLSATICVDLAGQLLRQDREELADGERRRILIACPYRPHARFLQLLITEEGLKKDVLAGTAHSLQGSEADVVILDLVNDEPHWRVGMFTPQYDLTNKRLLNVALTRARRRLVVVGDFDYIQKQAKKAFLGKDLVPFLLSLYPRVDAKEIVPFGLAARAARAQSSVTGGAVEADADRLVLTQDRFYAFLQSDLEKARQRIVIYSAFATQERIGQLSAYLRAAVERGVHVYVVTKGKADRSKREAPNYQKLERTLTDWGITVIHKRRMHEKLIFVDDEITWVGSLNPLSFSNTQEIMERRNSKSVTADYAKTVLLEELLAGYEDGQPSCPICSKEVVASEAWPREPFPFHWACVEKGCYTRRIDQPGPKDGLIPCHNCGKPVEYGKWGGEPVWRCTAKPQHRQKIARTHLRLPKMRELIPKRELKKLERYFSGESRQTGREKGQTQHPTLFDLSG